MTDISEFTYNTYAKIAAAFIEDVPFCRVHYGFDTNERKNILIVEGTGLYLRDVRCWLPPTISVKYGNTQDSIIFIDSNSD